MGRLFLKRLSMWLLLAGVVAAQISTVMVAVVVLAVTGRRCLASRLVAAGLPSLHWRL
jgi:hypothetical protein